LRPPKAWRTAAGILSLAYHPRLFLTKCGGLGERGICQQAIVAIFK
jgi:hypothetical protein